MLRKNVVATLAKAAVGEKRKSKQTLIESMVNVVKHASFQCTGVRRVT